MNSSLSSHLVVACPAQHGNVRHQRLDEPLQTKLSMSAGRSACLASHKAWSSKKDALSEALQWGTEMLQLTCHESHTGCQVPAGGQAAYIDME